MRDGHGRFWLLAAILVTINVVGLGWIRHGLVGRTVSDLRVLAALPTERVDDTDRFTLLFDQPLGRPEQVGQPLERAPFRLEPRPAGAWVFAAPDRLEYVLDAPLPAGRVFQITPADDFRQLAGRRLVGADTFRFGTRPLRVLACEVTSSDRAHATIELLFNQPVDPERLRDSLLVTAPGAIAGLDVTVLTAEPDERQVVRFVRPPKHAARVRIDPALHGFGGERPLGTEFVRRLDLPVAFAVLGAVVPAATLEERLTATIRFSAALDRDQALPEIAVTPPVAGLRSSITRRGLLLSGPFEPGRRYTVHVPETILAADGTPLGSARAVTVDVPPRRPAVRLPDGYGILSPRGNLTLDLRATGVQEIRLSAQRVHENNLVPAMRGARPAETARDVVNRTVQLPGGDGPPQELALDLRALLGAPLGVYHLTASATAHRWVSDSAVVCVSDIAITAKQQRDGLFVWVTSLRDGGPVVDAAVTALGSTNQLLAEAITGPDGTAILDIPPKHPDGPAWLVTARHGEDVALLRPGRRPWKLDHVDRSGRAAPTTYDVMLFAERGVYRPGEHVHLTGIIRGADGTLPEPFPLAVRLVRPDGHVTIERTVSWAEHGQGVFRIDLPTGAEGQTGPYRIEAAVPGSRERLGSTIVHVEAFVPLRLAVDAEAAAPRFGPGETAGVRIAARYLFGRPAAGLPARLTGTLVPTRHRSDAFADFTFGALQLPDPTKVKTVEAALDDGGRAEIELEGLDPSAPCRAELTASVTEPGSRSVSHPVSFRIDPIGRHLGLRAPAGVVASGHPVSLQWALVDADDRVTAPDGPLELLVERVDHDWLLEESDRGRTFRSVETRSTVETRTVTPTPARSVEVDLPGPGRYQVAVVERSSGATAQLELFASPDGAAEITSVESPQRLEVVLDQPSYRPGDEAVALVRAPFPGTLLLTVEARNVLAHHVVEMTSRSAEVPFVVPGHLRGDGFIAATVVRRLEPEATDWRPHRAVGMARLALRPDDHVLPIAIDVPSEAEPGARVTVRLQGDVPVDPARPAVVSLWAVDEGILATTAYTAPDPLRHFLAPLRSEVGSSDVFADLLPDHALPASVARIGGDADLRAMRRSPVPTRREEPAVVWHELVPLDGEGSAELELLMPRLHGAMRVMAVAVDGDRYGAAEKPVRLTAPLLVEASGPRAAAPGDVFVVPLRLDNTGDATLEVTVEMTTEGPLSLAVARAETVRLDPGATRRWWIDVRADGTGPALLTARATATSADRGTLLAESRVPVTVRPAGPLHQEVRLARLDAGGAATIEPAPGFLTGHARTTVTLAAMPAVELRPALEQLADYPYGCVEQTTSRLYALLALGNVLERTAPSASEPAAVADLVDAGVARLWSMQTPAGGLAYWPGGPDPSLWGTSYAALFLERAAREGHAIDRQLVQGMAAYLEDALRTQRSLDDGTRAMICRVLAAFDRETTSWLSTLSDRAETLDAAGRAHLAQAWERLGRRDRAVEALSVDELPPLVATTTTGRLTSAVRQDALLLEALLDVEPDHALIGPLVDRIEAARSGGRWGSTLGSASALVALSRYQARQGDAPRFRGTLEAGAERWTFDHATPLTVELSAPTGPMVIESEGHGVLYAVVRTLGLAADPPEAYDRRLEVRRRWLDGDGEPLDPATLGVGDLVLVEITIGTTGDLGDRRVGNVAIVDALPGGLEVENPNLLGSAGARHADTGRADRVEFLDDRVVIFASVGPKRTTYRYALRAVTAGSFALPPIQASCMYDEGIASLHGGGRLEIVP